MAKFVLLALWLFIMTQFALFVAELRGLLEIRSFYHRALNVQEVQHSLDF